MLKLGQLMVVTSASICLAGTVNAASVTYTHSASVGFSGSNGFMDSDSATSVAVDSDPDAIDIGIGGFSFYEASVQVSPISNFVMEGSLFGAGKLTAEVNISAEITTGPNERLSFSPFVIIEGGFLDTIDSVNSSLIMEWDVTGITSGPEVYSIEYGALQGPPPTIKLAGKTEIAIGEPKGNLLAEIKPSGNSIEIRPSLQRIEVGEVGLGTPPKRVFLPGTTNTLNYTVRITAESDQNGFTEGMAFRFQDPLVIDQDPAFNLGDLRSTNVGVSTVPLPAGLPLLLTAFGVTALVTRKRTRIG